MPMRSVIVTLEAQCINGRGIAPEEFLIPLTIQPGEVERIDVTGKPGHSPSIQISSKFSDIDVTDDEFEEWACPVFDVAIRFLENRSPQAFASMQSDGFSVRIRVEIDTTEPFPIFDFPDRLYALCNTNGIGLCSTYRTA